MSFINNILAKNDNLGIRYLYMIKFPSPKVSSVYLPFIAERLLAPTCYLSEVVWPESSKIAQLINNLHVKAKI